MDQNATNLPHLKRYNKSAANLWHLRTHITGGIVHGFGSCAYTDILQWPHDPNLTINILIDILLTRFMDLLKNQQTLPKRLYVQLDNCMRENKNRHVLAFLSLLVQERVFEEVSSRRCIHRIWSLSVDVVAGGTRISNGWSHPWGCWCLVWEHITVVKKKWCLYPFRYIVTYREFPRIEASASIFLNWPGL